MKIVGINDVRTIVWCVCAGLALASVYAYYAKGIAGKLIHLLIKAAAFDKESAKTLEELGCDTFVFRLVLRKGSMQNGTVVSENGRFYISEDMKEKTLARYSGEEASVGALALVLLIIAVLTAVIALLYPEIEELVKSWF